jgi:hypothetical protein
MGEATHQLVWRWGDWRALAVSMRPMEHALAGALLVVFDETDADGKPTSAQPRTDHPVLDALVGEARQHIPLDVKLLPCPGGGFSAIVYVPVRFGEPWPLSPIAATLCRPGTTLVLSASDAMRLEVDPQILAAWLRGGLKTGSGLVVLATANERDLTTLHTWAGRERTEHPASAARPSLKTAAKVAGLGGIAAAALAATAWVEKKVADARAQDTRGLGSFEPRGATAVTRLAELLMEELPPRKLAALERKARGRKNRGATLAVLEEWLHEHPDPSRVLAGQFAPFELAPIGLKHLGLNLHGLSDGREMAQRILAALGFGKGPDGQGLNSALCEVRRVGARLTAGQLGPRAAVTVGPTLEFATKCMLGFHLRLAFDSRKPRDALFKRVMQSLGEGRSSRGAVSSLDAMSLGSLVHACEDFERWRDHGKEVAARERHAAIYGTRAPDLGALRELVGLRNELAHHRPGSDPGQVAPRFLQQTERWLTGLRDEASGPRFFPALVRIESVSLASSGLLIRGVDDEGRREEIRSDLPLTVGSAWYMVPRTNPVRVRPLLVPAD